MQYSIQYVVGLDARMAEAGWLASYGLKTSFTCSCTSFRDSVLYLMGDDSQKFSMRHIQLTLFCVFLFLSSLLIVFHWQATIMGPVSIAITLIYSLFHILSLFANLNVLQVYFKMEKFYTQCFFWKCVQTYYKSKTQVTLELVKFTYSFASSSMTFAQLYCVTQSATLD